MPMKRRTTSWKRRCASCGGASGTGLAAMHCLASPPGRLNPEGVDSQQVLRRSRSDANRPSDKKTGGAALRRRSVLARPSPPGRLSQMQRRRASIASKCFAVRGATRTGLRTCPKACFCTCSIKAQISMWLLSISA